MMFDIETLFYKSDSAWFGWLANISILACAFAVLGFISWFVYGEIKGRVEEDEQVNSLTKELDKAYTTGELLKKEIADAKPKGSPFAPGTRKQGKQPAKHSA